MSLQSEQKKLIGWRFFVKGRKKLDYQFYFRLPKSLIPMKEHFAKLMMGELRKLLNDPNATLDVQELEPEDLTRHPNRKWAGVADKPSKGRQKVRWDILNEQARAFDFLWDEWTHKP